MCGVFAKRCMLLQPSIALYYDDLFEAIALVSPNRMNTYI